MYTDETTYPNPINAAGWDSPQFAGVIVIGAMLFLYLIRKGFRGVGSIRIPN
jgi:hypothetical protein